MKTMILALFTAFLTAPIWAQTGVLVLDADEYDVNEGDGFLTVTVSRIDGSEGTLQANLITGETDAAGLAGTEYDAARQGVDFADLNQLIFFQDGETGSIDIQIPINDDVRRERTEVFGVGLVASEEFLGEPSTAAVFIEDNDEETGDVGALRLTSDLYEVNESDGVAVVEVERINGSAGEINFVVGTVQLTPAQLGGSDFEPATPVDDYTDTGLQLRFEDGETGPIEIEVPIRDDGIPEADEVVGFAIFELPNEPIDIAEPENAAIIIRDDDQETPSQGVAVLDNSAYRAYENDGFALISVLRHDGSDGVLKVFLTTRTLDQAGLPGTGAIPGEDYEETFYEIVFEDGETGPYELPIPLIDDNRPEPDEIFVVELESAGGDQPEPGRPFRAAVTIADEDEVNEGESFFQFAQTLFLANESAGTMDVVIERLGNNTNAAEILFLTFSFDSVIEDDAATEGADFESVEALVSFEAGVSVKTITVPILEDGEIENEEGFALILLDPADPYPDEPVDEALGIIVDNDFPDRPGEILFSQPYYPVFENEEKAIIGIERLGGDLGERTVRVRTIAGTAIAGEDFQAIDQTITFADGQAGLVSIEVSVADDRSVEPEPESIGVQLIDETTGEELDQTAIIIIDDERLQTVIDSPRPGDSPIPAGTEIRFKGRVPGAPEDANLEYFWEARSTSGELVAERTGQQFTQVIEEPGIYEITCFAFSEQTLDTIPASVRIEVDTPGVAARITNPMRDEINVAVGTSVTFTGVFDPPEAKPYWFFLSNPQEAVSDTRFTHVFEEEGYYTLIFLVELPDGRYDEDHVSIFVGSRALDVAITEPADESTFLIGRPVQFRADVELLPSKRMEVELLWLISDGTVLEGQTPRHEFKEPGLYEVTLLGLVGDEERFDDSVIIYIEDPARAPVVDIDLPQDVRIQPGGNIFLRAKIRENRGYQREDLIFSWQFGDGRRGNLPVPGSISYPEAGTYTVSLTARVRETGLQSETVTRTITVSTSEDGEFEPNEDFAQAPGLQPGEYTNLALDESSAVDFYRFNVTNIDHDLVFELNFSGTVQVELFNAAQDLLGEGEISGEANVQLNGLPPGDYFIKFTSADAAKLKAGLSYSMNISVLNPALYYPDIQVTASFDTAIGIVNPTGGESSLEVSGFDAAGNLIDQVQLDLPARGRFHQSVSQVFGANAGEVAWIQVDADRDLVGYSRTESRDFREVYAVTASKQLRSELFVPHIAQQTDQWYTKSSVINGTDDSSTAEMNTAGTNTPLKVNNAFTRDNFDFLTRFGGTLPPDADWATFKEMAAKPALAGTEVFGLNDPNTRAVAGLELTDIRQDNPNFTYVGNNLYFTHIARDTVNFWTGIALVNISEIAQSLIIRGYGPDGAEVGNKTLTLQPGEKRVELAEAFLEGIGSPENVDWVLVEADLQIVGYELFGTHDFKQIAGLEATTGLKKELCYPFIDVDKNVFHGISVVNVNNQANNVTFTLYNNQGKVLATATEQLDPHQKKVTGIDALFNTTFSSEQVPGWLEVTADLPLAGFQLFVNTQNNEQMGALTAR